MEDYITVKEILDDIGEFYDRYIGSINPYLSALSNEERDLADRAFGASRCNALPGVYFIQNTSNGLIKIGQTGNLKQRFMNIKNGAAQYGCQIKLIAFIAVFDDMQHALEKFLHSKFTDKRIVGEWFDITKNDIEDYVCGEIVIDGIMIDITYDYFKKKSNKDRTNCYMDQRFVNEYIEPYDIDKKYYPAIYEYLNYRTGKPIQTDKPSNVNLDFYRWLRNMKCKQFGVLDFLQDRVLCLYPFEVMADCVTTTV